jgi:hypothetical protein
MLAGRHRRVAAATLALAAIAAAAGTAVRAAPAERPATELTRYVASLRAAARLAEQARVGAAGVTSKDCGGFAPAASRLVEAAAAAQKTFETYRGAKTRYGTQEEIGLIASLAVDLREARGQLGRAAGESVVPTAAEQESAEREISLFQTFLAIKIGDRLQVEGLEDVLTSRSFREVKAKVVAELQRRLRDRAEAELKRLVGLRIRLNVPLKEQIRDFLESELSSALSRLAVSAGPAGILVSLVGSRLVSLVGAALQEALRHKGSLEPRTNQSVKGFAALQQELRSLPKDATLDRVRGVVRRAERSLKATAFLEGDLRKARRAELLSALQTAKGKLETTLTAAKLRFLLDSDLVGEDFGVAIRYAGAVRADAERLAKKLGCTSPAGGGQVPVKGVAPSAKSCPPSFRMEALRSLPPYHVTGEFAAIFVRLEKTGPFTSKCLYESENGNEDFVIFIDHIPPGTPGALASGGCGSSAPDNPPFYRSRKRYLTVSGGERMMFTRAAGGNEKILRQALALAEAEGVGQACP